MIPKIIHYCWFGKKELPKEVKRYIESWKKYLPDYDIIEWNEENFDIGSINWTKQAYECKKYAFVSDYVRLYALYNYGGIYFDTDIEVIRNLDRFLNCNTLMGFEGEDSAIATGMIGSIKEQPWLKDLLNIYKSKDFIKKDGSLDYAVNVDLLTDILSKYYNIKLDNTYQELENRAVIYPREFFSPKSFVYGKINKTINTHTIHHFNASWHTEDQKKFWRRYRILNKFIGPKLSHKVLNYYSYYEKHGFNEVLKKVLCKLVG